MCIFEQFIFNLCLHKTDPLLYIYFHISKWNHFSAFIKRETLIFGSLYKQFTDNSPPNLRTPRTTSLSVGTYIYIYIRQRGQFNQNHHMNPMSINPPQSPIVHYAADPKTAYSAPFNPNYPYQYKIYSNNHIAIYGSRYTYDTYISVCLLQPSVSHLCGLLMLFAAFDIGRNSSVAPGLCATHDLPSLILTETTCYFYRINPNERIYI